MAQIGPNDTRHVVWATGMSLFKNFAFFVYYLIISVIFRVYLSVEGTRKAAMTQTGPNDARHVVWAVGTMSFFHFAFLIY